MNQIEFEKNSAPLLEYLEQREIKAVAFDVDNTVLDTGGQFHETLYALGLEISQELPVEIAPYYYEEISRQLENEIYAVYYKNKRKPVLIGKQYEQALENYLNELSLGDITERMRERIMFYQERHYTNPPKVYPSTKEILELILSSGREVVFNSHAQDDWTEMKIQYIASFIDEIDTFPYISVPITENKDTESWLRAYSKVDTKPENTLTVGDNFNADIVPAIEAGCKTVAWINSRGYEFPEGFILPEDVHLFIIENIGELRNLNINSRHSFANTCQ
ncbi:MAG: HAD-like domain [candidate division WS6 bacterium 36_33]|uniref:HAD-like domain n=1 Tax=candidate division WS6 bacterium 36_33 TaxID=1641388 RepID=A0A117LTP1_9BACT|nr:MAG: HAD-like domain [candidate division WS6 bacterium 36_33]